MSLYNQLFGVYPAAGLLLKSLGLEINAVPRLRDAWYWDGEIVVYTRTGGPNRKDDEWAKGNDALRAHPLYLRDEDDEYDGTYALWYFKLPPALVPIKEHLDSAPRLPRPAERWKALLDGMKANDTSNPEVKRALDLGKTIMEKLDNSPDGGTIEL